jgi:hypothetical protein
VKVGSPLYLRRRVGLRSDVAFVEGHVLDARGAPVAVACEVGGNPEERVAAMLLVLMVRARPQEAVIRFLQEIVGGLAIAGDSRQVPPQRPRRPIVEGAERLFIHFERDLLGGCQAKAFDFGQGDVMHCS